MGPKAKSKGAALMVLSYRFKLALPGSPKPYNLANFSGLNIRARRTEPPVAEVVRVRHAFQDGRRLN
jgi:hypothetical protein